MLEKIQMILYSDCGVGAGLCAVSRCTWCIYAGSSVTKVIVTPAVLGISNKLSVQVKQQHPSAMLKQSKGSINTSISVLIIMGSAISLWPKTNHLNTSLYLNLLIKAGASKLHKTPLREAVHVVAVLT